MLTEKAKQFINNEDSVIDNMKYYQNQSNFL